MQLGTTPGSSRLTRGIAALCLTLLVALAAPMAFAQEYHHHPHRISRDRAEAIALDQAPSHSFVRGSELVTVDDRPVWSVTVVTPRRHLVTRVRISARSGNVISSSTFHPHHEEHEH